MNEFDKRKCLDITNKMLHKDLCRPFRNKVDPEKDGAPDYLDIVKNPMDLVTIRKKLIAGDYTTIEQWSEDVNLTFKNAKLYNEAGSLIYLIAQEMEQWFARKVSHMPHNKEEDWMVSLRKYSAILSRLSNHPPPAIVPMHNIVLDTQINQTTVSIPLESIQSQDSNANAQQEKGDDAAYVEEVDAEYKEETNKNGDDVKLH